MVLSSSPDVIFPPTDLWSDEPPVETQRHLLQIIILLASLDWWWRDRFTDPSQQRKDYFTGANLTIYYSTRQRRSEDFRGPDFFVVLNTEYKERKSWTVWAEGGQYPNFILEILSDSTAQVDRGLKKQLYQDIFRTPEYFWFDPFTLEFQGFQLNKAHIYEEIPVTERGWMWSQELQLFLGLSEDKLRFFTPEGVLVPIPSEAALQERQRAEQEMYQAQQERQRADALAQRLRKLGFEP